MAEPPRLEAPERPAAAPLGGLGGAKRPRADEDFGFDALGFAAEALVREEAGRAEPDDGAMFARAFGAGAPPPPPPLGQGGGASGSSGEKRWGAA